MIAIEKSSPICFCFSSSELCFVHVFRCHFILDVVFIYRAKHFFFFNYYFKRFVPFFYFVFTRSSLLFVCQYVCVCHISFSGEGLEFQKNTHPIFRFHFIFKCTHFLDREQTVWLFSQCIFVQIYMESGEGGRSTIGVCSLQIQLYWIS